MEPFTLVVTDTTGIQGYIFGSNRLRENVGASHLVHQAAEGWLMSEPDTLLPPRHNIIGGQRNNDVYLEKGQLDAELLYAGGGNAAILFAREEDARAFARKLSSRLLCEAPGLDAVLVSEPVDWNSSLADAMQRALDKLARKKVEREWSQPTLGLGVTAQCASTGLPANVLVQEPEAEGRLLSVSAEVEAKWDQNEDAKQRLETVVFGGQRGAYELPDQFEHLGRSKGELSYIAVVHADGNNMGRVMDGIRARYRGLGADANRTFIGDVRRFSDAAKCAGVEALKDVASRIQDWKQRGLIKTEGDYLPFRPLVYGGDDVTFVCDGRIGLAAAHAFLEAFGRHQIPNAEGQMKAARAAAGVAIVKVRYPFARAYQLSEQLCKNAKDTFGRQVQALDWHLAQGGLFGRLSDIRSREYGERREAGQVVSSLLMRPLSLAAASSGDWHTWDNFTSLLKEFQNRKRWPRNKVMALREALRAGDAAVQAFVHNYGSLLPAIGIPADQYRRTGFDGRRCVYFDAIEMIEQEVPE